MCNYHWFTQIFRITKMSYTPNVTSHSIIYAQIQCYLSKMLGTRNHPDFGMFAVT